MVRAQLESILHMAGKIEPQLTARPAPWIEYQLARATQNLRDVTQYAAHGRQKNPSPGYMARQSLTQIQEDAAWLYDVIDPQMELAEWATYRVYETAADIGDIYQELVRADYPVPSHSQK